jgi:protoporphyrinogen oxidase
MAATVAVVGGGPMGLAVAYQLALEGVHPVVFEADDRLGGMAASFQFADQTLERYYHFHCLSDHAFMQLLQELGLVEAMRWRQTSMGFFLDGRLYPWGSASSVLRFRRLPLSTRIRYLLHAIRCLSLRNWRHLDSLQATTWLQSWLGAEGYTLLWQKLFAYKFYHHADAISAAWIWSRIRRLGRSRRWLKETLGFLDGGSQRWIRALENRLRELGCEIFLSAPVLAIRSSHQGAGAVVRTSAGERAFDAVITTIPLPQVAPILEAGGAEPSLVARYANQASVACACVVLQTRQPITANFWTNINDERFAIPGIIEFSNLRPLKGHITYVPYYMPASHPSYQRPDQAFIDEAIFCLKAINPRLAYADIQATHCSRYRYAQPVCGTDFQLSLPPLNPLPGITTVDTTVYYPEDRGISESIGYGRDLAKQISRNLHARGE